GEEVFDPRSFIIKGEQYGIPQTRHRVILLGIRNDIPTIPDTFLIPQNVVKVVDVIFDLPRLRSGLSKGVDTGDRWISVLRESQDLDVWNGVDETVHIAILDAIERASIPDDARGNIYLNRVAHPGYMAHWYL